MNETLSTLLVVFLGLIVAVMLAIGIMIVKVLNDVRLFIVSLKNGAHTISSDATVLRDKVHSMAAIGSSKQFSNVMGIVGIGLTVFKWFIKKRSQRRSK